MNARIPALVTVAVLALAGAAGTAVIILNPVGGAAQAPDAQGAGADEEHLHEGMSGDMDHDQLGMERPRFTPDTGKTPTAETAKSLEQVSSIRIDADQDFSPATGVRSGSGTLVDPFVISGYYVTGDLWVADTDACFIVKENYIGGQLTLNWNGQCTHVHHNYIRDLRVNENNARTGYATGGLLEDNQIGVVGQLRHYDGEFRNNIIGPLVPTDLFDQVLETTPLIGQDVLLGNIDGFNQGLIHHNTWYGAVNLDLHGHHHGTGFFAPHSHYHGDNMTKMAEHEHDHSDRWTSVAFTDNKIIDDKGYGLLYDDQNHAGDDRTANSETTEALNMPHQHHTMIEIARNHLEGAGIWIDVYNADDENHYKRNPGTLLLTDNVIAVKERQPEYPLPFFQTNYLPYAGIQLQTTKEFDAMIARNQMTFTPVQKNADPVGDLLKPFFFADQTPVAIDIQGVRDANLTITGNSADGFEYGVRALSFDEKVYWTVLDNDFGGASTPVWYDGSVANRPTTEAGPGEPNADEDDGHQHDPPPATSAARPIAVRAPVDVVKL